MKTLDGKCIIPIKGIDYVLLTDYVGLLNDKDKLDKELIFKNAYVRSLKKIIYKLYEGIELTTLEMGTLFQSLEENGKRIFISEENEEVK